MSAKPIDVYTDGVAVTVTPVDVVLHLQVSQPGEGQEQRKMLGYVRMSLEHAKVLAILLRKSLKNHEDEVKAEIPIHPRIFQNLGYSREEDW